MRVLIVKLKRSVAVLAALSFLAPAAGAAAPATRHRVPVHRGTLLSALQQDVKYVFVIYQENRSFDSYFGTFPGADGIYSSPPASTPGFDQSIENVDGTFSTISPFRIGPAQFAADTDDVGHAHAELIEKMDVGTNGVAGMDKYALTEEQTHYSAGQKPTLEAKQYGELTMAYEDCDTIPLLWNYANRFVLYDHISQSHVGPSTLGALEIISGQVGETQYGLHPTEGYTGNGGSGAAVPVTNDSNPHWGPGVAASGNQLNLTYAALPLTLAGANANALAATDPSAATDFADIPDDVAAIHAQNGSPVGWGWYQEGYDKEPGETGANSLSRYIPHHNGPQYFGYIANTPAERANIHGLGNFYTAVHAGSLPAQGGVFFVKGGYKNILGLEPADPDAAVQAKFTGDDDHPGYSDAQISEANVAELVNFIAASKYWSQSAIIIAWDDSEGDYDHVPPTLNQVGPGSGIAPKDYLANGPRVPLIVISPFAKINTVVHTVGNQGSVLKFIDALFDLTPLGNLPDELKGETGASNLGHANFDADDATSSPVDNLLDAFDPGRLAGTTAPLPASYVEVPSAYVTHLPQATGIGCGAIGVIPVDYLRGVQNTIPADFNPRPATDPTTTGIRRVSPLQPRYTDPDD
jgi:phospholipase C